MKTNDNTEYAYSDSSSDNFFNEENMGRCIRRERRQQKLSLEELSRKAYMSRSYLSQIERGQRSMTIDYANRIAAGLGKKPGELFLAEQSGYAEKEAGPCETSSEEIKKELWQMLSSYDHRELRLVHKLMKRIDFYLK